MREQEEQRRDKRYRLWGESERERATSSQSGFGLRTNTQKDYLGFYGALGLNPAGGSTHGHMYLWVDCNLHVLCLRAVISTGT